MAIIKLVGNFDMQSDYIDYPAKLFLFQPFESRMGVESVIALKFKYDKYIVESIKNTLKYLKSRNLTRSNAGGWLDFFKVWYIEPNVWDEFVSILNNNYEIHFDFENKVNYMIYIDEIYEKYKETHLHDIITLCVPKSLQEKSRNLVNYNFKSHKKYLIEYKSKEDYFEGKLDYVNKQLEHDKCTDVKRSIQ